MTGIPDDLPNPEHIVGCFIRTTGKTWALANPGKPGWMNPKFWYGLKPRPAPVVASKVDV